MGKYAEIFAPREYHAAGNKNIPEMSNSLSEMAAKVVDNLPADERQRFQNDIEQYTMYDQLPSNLKELIDRYN